VREGSRWLFTNTDEDRGCEITIDLSGGGFRKCKVYRDRDRTQEDPVRLWCEISDQDGTGRWKLWTNFESGSQRYTFDPQFLRVNGLPDVRIVESPGTGWQPALYDLYSQTVEQGRRRIARDIMRDIVPDLDDIEILTEGSSPVLQGNRIKM
jgi:hypothetical protein